MSWGISENAPEIEKIKTEIADVLNGMNSVCKISYGVYSELFDVTHKLIQKAYELGIKSQIEIMKCCENCKYYKLDRGIVCLRPTPSVLCNRYYPSEPSAVDCWILKDLPKEKNNERI